MLETLNSEERVHSELARALATINPNPRPNPNPDPDPDPDLDPNPKQARVLATVNTRRAAGGLAVDPPAVSRIHQTLSDGNLGFFQACKLEDTPLPFPYAQAAA